MSFEFPRANKPEDMGLSSPRLARIRDALQADIDKGLVPGALTLVARRGQIASLDALGYRDREAGAAMKSDTIFRIASMTKPFTSVAAMMLGGEGRLLIADPGSRYIPEFANLEVVVDSDDRSAGKAKTERSRREMSVHDLLRHTSGLTYAHLTGPFLKSRYESASVADEKQTNTEMVGKLGRLPLAYQPGTTWQYGVSTDVLGRVVEVAGGMELDRFIAERICNPLGLSNTGFGPIDEARAAQPQIDRVSGKRPPMRDTSVRPRWISGGSGLLSTAGDFARFAQMLMNGGELGGTRLLSPTTVRLMTSDAGHSPKPLDRRPVRRACADGGTRDRFWPRLCRAHACRPQPFAGLGRRFLVERRHRHLLLDRSATAAHCDSDDASPGRTAALSLSHAHAGVSGNRGLIP